MQSSVYQTLICIKNTSGIMLNTLSDSVGLGWGLRLCFCNKFPGGADAAVHGHSWEEQG